MSKLHALLLAMFGVLLLSGCTPDGSGKGIALSGLYDNRGGFAHGGHAIELRGDGTFREWSYTDVLGSQRTLATGTWVADGSLVKLVPDKGSPTTMHQLTFGDDVFLLTEDQFKSLPKERGKPQGPAYLRKVAKKSR